MSDKKVISILERPFGPAHNRKEQIEEDARNIVPYMRELHEICAAA